MEAKDTVMSEKQMEDIIWHTAREGIPTQRGYGGALIKAQAEISFGLGIKEVLDSIHYKKGVYTFPVNPEDWEKKLEDWGIENSIPINTRGERNV